MITDNISVYLDHVDTPLLAEMTDILATVGISFFMYYVNYTDGSEIKCTNRPDWTRYFVENQLYRHSMMTLPPDNYQLGFYWLNEIENPEINRIRAKQFGIEDVLVWMNPVEAGCEMVFFGTDGRQPMLTFYLNHLSELRQFIIYFKNQLSPQLASLQLERLLLPNRFEERQQSWQPGLSADDLQLFRQRIRIEKFYLAAEYQGREITSRELEVLRELAGGASYKAIAALLHISPRTVETHLANLKDKLGCHSRDALRDFFKSHFER